MRGITSPAGSHLMIWSIVRGNAMDSTTDFVDPYLDPETGLLRNKAGARTKVALDEAEGDLTFARLVHLMPTCWILV